MVKTCGMVISIVKIDMLANIRRNILSDRAESTAAGIGFGVTAISWDKSPIYWPSETAPCVSDGDLGQIEQQSFSFLRSHNVQQIFLADRSAIARTKRRLIKRHSAPRYLQPSLPLLF
jgi:hypothetical protein